MHELIWFVLSLVVLSGVYFFILHCQKKYRQFKSKRYTEQHRHQLTRIVFEDKHFFIQDHPFVFPYNAPLSSIDSDCKLTKNGYGAIDHFFVVNRRCDSGRLQLMRQQLASHVGVTMVESNVLEAVNASRLTNTLAELKSAKIMHPGFNYTFPRVCQHAQMWRHKGILGHYLSLYKALLLAEHNDWHNFLWIEDDCLFNQQSWDQLNTFITDFDQPWDFINLGVSAGCYKRNAKSLLQQNAFGLYSVADACGLMYQTHAVLFNQSAWKKIISQFFPMCAPSDIALGNWASSKRVDVSSPWTKKHPQLFNGYFAYPELAYQEAVQGQSSTADSAYWA
jgi:hypothetical protein